MSLSKLCFLTCSLHLETSSSFTAIYTLFTGVTQNKHVMACHEAAVTLLMVTLPYFQPDGESLTEQTEKGGEIVCGMGSFAGSRCCTKAAPLGATRQLSSAWLLLWSAYHQTGTRNASKHGLKDEPR